MFRNPLKTMNDQPNQPAPLIFSNFDYSYLNFFYALAGRGLFKFNFGCPHRQIASYAASVK
jgi:hypothetical protein